MKHWGLGTCSPLVGSVLVAGPSLGALATDWNPRLLGAITQHVQTRIYSNRGRIRSDEGFEVTFVDRSQSVYVEKGRRVTIAGELLRDGFVAETARQNVGRWLTVH